MLHILFPSFLHCYKYNVKRYDSSGKSLYHNILIDLGNSDLYYEVESKYIKVGFDRENQYAIGTDYVSLVTVSEEAAGNIISIRYRLNWNQLAFELALFLVSVLLCMVGVLVVLVQMREHGLSGWGHDAVVYVKWIAGVAFCCLVALAVQRKLRKFPGEFEEHLRHALHLGPPLDICPEFP
jgi:hypothetical protein